MLCLILYRNNMDLFLLYSILISWCIPNYCDPFFLLMCLLCYMGDVMIMRWYYFLCLLLLLYHVKWHTVISQIPIFSNSMQIYWNSRACKLPCKIPYFIAKIRVRVCRIEWTLTIDNLDGMLLREYACIKSWIRDDLVSFASDDTPAARTPNQLRVTFSVKEVSHESADLQDW